MRATTREAIHVDYTLPLHVAFVTLKRCAVLEVAAALPRLWEMFPKKIAEQQDLPSDLQSWCLNFQNRDVSDVYHYISVPTVSGGVLDFYRSYARTWPANVHSRLSFSAWRVDRVLHSSVKAPGAYSPTSINDSDKCAVKSINQAYRSAVVLNQWFNAFDESSPWAATEANIARLIRLLHLVKPVNFDQRPVAYQEMMAKITLDFCNLAAESYNSLYNAVEQAMMVQEQFPAITNEFFDSFLSILRQNNVFQTVSGKFGRSILPVMEGDLIIYVPGGRHLHVVTADARHYRTTAKIEGYMEDELLSIIKNPAADIETFHLT